MKTVFFIGRDGFGEVKNRIFGDDLTSRQSITIRENSALGLKKEGYYIVIDGDEQAIKKAREMIKEKGKELQGKDAKEVMDAIESQESSAAEGFGAIFG